MLLWAALSWGQSVELTPSSLARVPVAGLAEGRYWQQLVVALDAPDAASDSTVSLVVPLGTAILDLDRDGHYEDEIRVVYRPAANELPGFAASPLTSSARLVVRSSAAAAAGGRLYLQFPLSVTAAPSLVATPYGRVSFADHRETDLAQGPVLDLVVREEFRALGGMDLVHFAAPLAPAADTVTAPDGAWFPEPAQVLVEDLPDLVFDGGQATGSNLLPVGLAGIGDGNDDNDTRYSFYWSADPALTQVTGDHERAAMVARSAGSESYGETEAGAHAVRLALQDLPAGTWYLYAVCRLTGGVPLARSRAVQVRHQPVISSLVVGAGSGAITLDTGRLLDLDGVANGQGQDAVSITYRVTDLDDSVRVHLFAATAPDLAGPSLVVANGQITGLSGGLRLSPASGLEPGAGTFVWNLAEGAPLPADDYYLYLGVADQSTVALRRSTYAVHVRHSPFLQLDALADSPLAIADTVVTGGLQPQRYLTLTWGRGGADGDADLDDDARIGLYFSPIPARSAHYPGGWPLPGGARALLDAVGSQCERIVDGLHEDPDARAENQFVWDLWAAARSGAAVPPAGQPCYVYGVIADATSMALCQMHGGQANDAGARVVFMHPPALAMHQPAADLTAEVGDWVHLSWEAMDLDSQARMRVVVSAADGGLVSDYASLLALGGRVANSTTGLPGLAVDSAQDLSEADGAASYDLSTTGLSPGSYYLYVAITDEAAFSRQSLARRTWGRLQLQAAGSRAGLRVHARPESFSLGTDGQRQTLILAVDAGSDTVDLVQLALQVDGRLLSVVDQDLERTGIQPFAVGAGFSPARLITNRLTVHSDGTLGLLLEYLEPTEPLIRQLDAEHPLASLCLQSLGPEGQTVVSLQAADASGLASRLVRDGTAVASLAPGPLASGQVVLERGILRGRVDLEGRAESGVAVDLGLWPRGRYLDLADSLLVTANDVDASRSGVQLHLAADGGFEVRQVPAGQYDVRVHRDGYLDGVITPVSVVPGQVTDAGVAATPGTSGGRMLAGDVAGYRAADGSSPPDNEITLADWDFLAAAFATGSVSGLADLNADGGVDVQDLSLVGANYLRRGPQPVYRRGLAAPSPLTGQAPPPGARLVAGDEIEVNLADDAAAAGIRAFQVELRGDPTAWSVVAVQPGRGPVTVLSASRRQPGGWQWVFVAAGRQDVWRDDQPLVTWRLRAQRDGATPPVPKLGVGLATDDRMIGAADFQAATARPQSPQLGQNYPNPFNPGTVVPVCVPAGPNAAATPVRVEVYDLVGQRVAVLWDGPLSPGEHRFVWDGRDARGARSASGVFLCRLQAGDVLQVKRMVRVR